MSLRTFCSASAIAIPPMPRPATREVTSYPRLDRIRTPPTIQAATLATVLKGLMKLL